VRVFARSGLASLVNVDFCLSEQGLRGLYLNDLQRDLDAQKYIDSAGVMLVILNCNGQVTMINPRGCSVLGYSHDEIINQNWFELCVPPHLRDDVFGVYQLLMKGNAPEVEFYENDLINKQGELITVLFHNTTLFDSEGKVEGILFSGEDITEMNRYKIQLESSLLGAVSVLSRAVEARDPYTAGHERRVAVIAAAIAKKMGVDDTVGEAVRHGTVIHDVGKIQAPA